MKILDRLPYFDKPSLLSFPAGTVEVRAFQVIVWLRIGRSVFPAVLDTGHSHNLSIPRRLLSSWGGIESLPEIGRVEVNRQSMPQVEASVWIHRNPPGTREPTSAAFQLTIENGITIVPDETAHGPRLPVLGLRAISASNLRLLIDGRRRSVTLKTGWF
jgi:hypothetical protein